MLAMLLFFLTGPIFAETVESKGRINWAKLKIEEKKVNLEAKKLQIEVVKLQLNACKDIYGADEQAKASCISKYLVKLSEVFSND